MVDIQSATASTLASSNSSTNALTSFQASISALSEALQDITRTIQTNATPVALASNGDLTLATAQGEITVNFMQQMGQLEKQNLTQQLMTMISAQKPLTLSLQPNTQPGLPPAQAVILLPTAPPQNAQPAAPQAVPVLPVNVGETLPAIVLPPSVLSIITPSAAQTLQIPPALAQMIEEMPAPVSVLPPAANSAAPAAPAPPTAVTGAAAPAAAPELAVAVQQAPANASALPQPANNPAPVLASAPEETVVATPLATASPAPTQPAPQTTSPEVIATATPPTIAAETAAPSLPASNAAPVLQPAPQNLATLLQPGNEISLHVDAVLPPATAPQSLPPLAANQIAATVAAKGTDGNLILNAGGMNLFVKAPVTAPVGSILIITVGPAREAPLLPLPVIGGNNFPALPQALEILAQNAPQLMQQIMATRLPQPTEVLPGALLFLLSAFKQGNLRNWLGSDPVETLLRAGKEDIVASLTRELSDAGQPAQDNVVGDWRSFPIPLFAQQQFQALTLHVHHDRNARRDRAEGAPSDKIRFVIDMRLSRLGSMQIDGFVQPRQMDMILRSETTLPPGFHSDLRSAYLRALGAVGYSGALHFQVGHKYWVVMQQQARGVTT